MENASQARVQITPLQQGLTADTWLSKQLWQMLSAEMKNKQTLICALATNSTNLRLRLNLKQLDVSTQHMLHQASDKHLNQSNWYAAVTSKRTARQGQALPDHVTQRRCMRSGSLVAKNDFVKNVNLKVAADEKKANLILTAVIGPKRHSDM